MFYHHRPIAHVRAGRVLPRPLQLDDTSFNLAYRWLGGYCGFCPQIWLSRSRSEITGYSSRGQRDSVLFGFESIQGFPVAYGFWEELVLPLLNVGSLEEAQSAVEAFLDLRAGIAPADPVAELDAIDRCWIETRDLDLVLRHHLFVLRDQVVVPALNLKAAKRIICRDERHAKILRRRGFIKDRIELRGPPPRSGPFG